MATQNNSKSNGVNEAGQRANPTSTVQDSKKEFKSFTERYDQANAHQNRYDDSQPSYDYWKKRIPGEQEEKQLINEATESAANEQTTQYQHSHYPDSSRLFDQNIDYGTYRRSSSTGFKAGGMDKAEHQRDSEEYNNDFGE